MLNNLDARALSYFFVPVGLFVHSQPPWSKEGGWGGGMLSPRTYVFCLSLCVKGGGKL